MMDQTELRQPLEEIEYECEVLIQARFHFRGRKDDKLGHVTTAWVELHKLDNVGRETVERKIKEYVNHIHSFVAIGRGAQRPEAWSEEETQTV